MPTLAAFTIPGNAPHRDPPFGQGSHTLITFTRALNDVWPLMLQARAAGEMLRKSPAIVR